MVTKYSLDKKNYNYVVTLKVFRVFSLVWESFASSGPEISFMCLDRQDPRVSGGKINYHPLVPIQGPSGSCISIKVRSHIHHHPGLKGGRFTIHSDNPCQPKSWRGRAGLFGWHFLGNSARPLQFPYEVGSEHEVTWRFITWDEMNHLKSFASSP